MPSNLSSVTNAAANQAPLVATQLPDLNWSEGVALQYTVPVGTFTDPDGSVLTYSASQSDGTALPTWLSFNATTRVFSGTAPASSPNYTVRVTATDPGGAVHL